MGGDKPTGIFIIEDNADNLWTLEAYIRKGGARVINSRASGRLFFKWINENLDEKIDILFLDIQIPREDGYTVLKQIRTHPALKDTKVIAITANTAEQDVEKCRESGFDGFIGKPLLPDRFP